MISWATEHQKKVIDLHALLKISVLFPWLLLLLVSGSMASEPGDTPAFQPVQGYEAINAGLSQTRQQAIDENKLQMVIMGANWCHDSRAFIKFLDDPGFAALIDQRYVAQRVNVGYYEVVREVINLWDIPVIYGTPTVLVIEPVTNTVLNHETLPLWRNASTFSVSDAVDYFDDYVSGPPPALGQVSPALETALSDIDRFEREQAERIYAAYAVLGEMMRGMGDDSPGPQFRSRWNELASMRSKITGDLDVLRQSAQEQDATGVEDIKLAYPTYPLFVD